jgi:hypothetical protein
MSYLNKGDILGASDDEFVDVDVPEWGGKVRIKGLSGAERDRFESSLAKMHKGQMVPDLINSRARLVAMSIVDDNGRRMFADTEVVQLGSKSSKALDRVFEAATRLSGINPEEIEKIQEDFDGAQSESSTSD